MRILVTGATGFVGRNLLPKLMNENYSLLCVVRDINLAQKQFGNQVLYCTIEQSDLIVDFQPDICIHMASYLTSANDAAASDKIIDANIVFGCKLLNTLKDVASLKLFVNFGTFAEYRLGPSNVSQAYLYSASKTAFKEILQYYADISGYKYIHIIPYTIYGGEDTHRKVIDLLKISLNSNESIKMSEGAQILDFIHVFDVVDFLVYIIKNRSKIIENPTIDYHLGTGVGTSIKDLAKMIESKYKKKCNVVFGAIPYRERDIMYAVAPIGQLIQIGWRPSRRLEDYI